MSGSRRSLVDRFADALRSRGGQAEEAAAQPAPRRLVRAGGGIVGDGEGRVLLIHRPQYDDWTFPKGKAERGEDDLACALREVEEETGLICHPDRELASAAYVDAKGRDKLVRYWAMTPLAGDVRPYPPEVDEVRWVTVAEARAELTYDHDRPILDSYVRAPAADPRSDD